jgi:argininosuccinate lyase
MNPLGACAIGGTSIGINRERTTELLGFEGLVYNSIDAISSRDYIHETLSLLSLISLQFSRMTEDLLLWSSKEFDFIELSDKYCSVSSVMPQKKNPDTLELTRSKCAQIISNSFNSSLIIKSVPTGYFRDFQDLKPLIIDSFSRIHMICDILEGIFSTLKINFKKMKDAVEDSYILALDLAELLVQEFKIPFRKTHNIVGSLVKNSEKPLDLLDSEKIENILRKYDEDFQITESQLAEIKNFNKCLRRRKSKGSPSQLELKSFLKKVSSIKKIKEKSFQSRLRKLEQASDLRNDIIRDLIEN